MPKTMGLMGRKVGMTRVFAEDGRAISVTLIEAGPCVVLQKKTEAKEGYGAVQLGFAPQKESRLTSPVRGHLAAAGKGGFRFIREFRAKDPEAYEVGQDIRVEQVFRVGDLVDVRARSKGKGFQGVVKRHGFKGGRATHGSMFHRAPGSIGQSSFPSRVIKGKKLPGQMGDTLTMKKNLTVVDLRPEDNILVVKGSVPGPPNALVQIYSK
ncbi:MAG: 50S ribosomal protein L3 [Thermodesulfobacteriota bacterium]